MISLTVDYFISYKREDSDEFAMILNFALRNHGLFKGWFDGIEIQAGKSILSEIEKGLTNSYSIIIVFSPNYFKGWSEQERKAAFHLATARNINIIPIWYGVDYKFVLENAPMFADLNAIICDTKSHDIVHNAMQSYDVIAKLLKGINIKEKLFESFFRCVYQKYPDDPNLRFWIAQYDLKIQPEKVALGAAISKIDLFNSYSGNLSFPKECEDCWRRLYIFLSEEQYNNERDENYFDEKYFDEKIVNDYTVEPLLNTRGKYPNFLADYFLVYKKPDAKAFAVELDICLKKAGLYGWLTKSEVQGGTATLVSDQAGINNSLTIIIVLSHDYFNDYADTERNAIIRLANLKSINLIPIWYDLGYDYILQKAPILANIKALLCNTRNETISATASELSRDIKYIIERTKKGDKLFELFFRCLDKCYPGIPDLKVWIASWEGNVKQMEEIIWAGGLSPNLTALDIFKEFTRKSLIGPECMDAWKTLVMYLRETGEIEDLEDLIDL